MSDTPVAAAATPRQSIRNYAIVTLCYWVFTLSDGALRMLVLLYLHEQGHPPLEIASFFVFYEFFGVLTNLYGGWLGARVGLKAPLVAGLTLQVVGLIALAQFVDGLTVLIVMAAQACSGIAKDLTKMSAKSYIKIVVPDGDGEGRGQLLRWVSWLTGSKNALKGVGFFMGGALLAGIGFAATCWAMAAVLALTSLCAGLALPRVRVSAASKAKITTLFAQTPALNWLAAARFFLFASRDAWFVLALPIYLGTELGLAHGQVGAFLAVWVIVYGAFQALAPKIVGARARAEQETKFAQTHGLAGWTFALLLPLAGLGWGLQSSMPTMLVVIVGLLTFAVVFATNSALHSYLVVAFAERGAVAKQVGFYYAANALGRLLGTVASGLLFQLAGQGLAGLMACFAASALFVALAGGCSLPLRRIAR